MENKKLLNDTKARFLFAYNHQYDNFANFNDMLYYMNVLAMLKNYDEKITAKQLFEMIDNGEY